MADREVRDFETTQGRKRYVSPRIVHTEEMSARATTCAKADTNSCAAGPIQS